MKIALFGNEFSPKTYIKYIKHLIQKLENENIEILIQQQFYDFLQENISILMKTFKPMKEFLNKTG